MNSINGVKRVQKIIARDLCLGQDCAERGGACVGKQGETGGEAGCAGVIERNVGKWRYLFSGKKIGE